VSVGALVGIGITTGKVHWKAVSGIVLSWVITLPCAAALAAIFMMVLRILHPAA
jgi:PiT family inorganic phosphate transporter